MTNPLKMKFLDVPRNFTEIHEVGNDTMENDMK